MSNIDDRIINLKLDDNSLQEGANRATSTLSKLTSVLKMKGATEGLTAVDEASKRVDFSAMQKAAESVGDKFTMLRLVAANALGNIASQAVTTGASLVKSLTLAPVIDGFHEYETQMNSVQTILANTASKGSTIKDVNKALAELNTYADKTIYNFTEMTRNIGTFTAAGVDLDTSVQSIKGIANLAAVSGSNSQQASTAMYQLSQAISSGTVRLMDWNSVVNAGMGGEVFQKALERTSANLKTGATEAIKAKGSFRESLETGWLTTKVLTETLKQFQLSTDTATQYNNSIKTLVSEGYTQEQAKQIADMAKTAGDAATKVKTFSQLMDTLKEAIGSGWTNTFQTLFGDFEEARQSWTALSNVLGDIVSNSATARNTLLNGWADLGGRKELFGIFTDSLKLVMSYLGPLKEGFRDIFPPTTAQMLFNITKGIHNFIESITLSTSQMKMLRETVHNFLSPLGLLKDGFDSLFKIIFRNAPKSGSVINTILVALNSLSKVVAFVTDGIRAFTSGFGNGVEHLNVFGSAVKSVTSYIQNLGKQANTIGQKVSEFAQDLGSAIGHGLSVADKKIGEFAKDSFGVLKKTFDWLKNNISFGDILNALLGASTISALHNFSGLIGKVKDGIDKLMGIFGKGGDTAKKSASAFSEVLDSLNASLQAFTQGIKAGSLLAIAGSIMLLAQAMKTISAIDPGKIVYSLGAMSAMFVLLNLSFKSITKSLNGFDGKGLISAGVSIVLMSIAINKLGDAMTKISKLDVEGIAKGLITIKVLIKSLTKFINEVADKNVMIKTSVSLLALAASINVISDAMVELGSLSWEGLAKGIIGFTVAIGALQLSIKNMDEMKISLRTSVALIAIAQAAKMLSYAMQNFSGLSWGEIFRGLTAMAGSLLLLNGTMFAMSKIGNLKSLIGSIGLVIAVQSLSDIASALSSIGKLSWSEVSRGLTGMGVSFGILSGVMNSLSGMKSLRSIGSAISLVIVASTLENIGKALSTIGKLSWNSIAKGLVGVSVAMVTFGAVLSVMGSMSPFGAIAGAAAILIASKSLSNIGNALVKIGGISWNGIAKGLVGMGLALTEIGTVITIVGTISPFGAIVGAAAILLAVQSLEAIGKALTVMGSLSWGGVTRGLVAMGVSLTELAVIIGTLGTVAPVGAIVGAASILLASKALGEVAKSLSKLGSLSWDEIKKGLVAMNGALGSLALGGLLNTFSGIGASAISTMAKPLGDLATSMLKWKNVRVPTDLGNSMKTIADAVSKFMWGSWGAGAIAESATGLGAMADAMLKWRNVSVPNGLDKGLSSLAEGVKSFTWAFVGGWSIGAVVGPLGDLASSILKWKNVYIPNDLDKGLASISNGIKAFTWAFVGGWSLSSITGPLGDLANSVNKWDKVYIPDGIEKGLTALANGVKAFSFAALGGLSLNTIVKPLGDLAGAVAKWSNVFVPSDLKQGLWDIKDGVAAFSDRTVDSGRLNGIVKPLGDLAGAITKWSSVKVPTGLTQGLWDIKNGVSAFGEKSIDGARLNSIVQPLGNLAGAIAKWSGVKVPSGLTQGLWDIKNGVSSFGEKSIDGNRLNSIVQPLGDLAGSIAKWASVKIPAGLTQGLWDIKNGVAAFGEKSIDGARLNSIVEPLGNLAGSIAKWSGVQVPTGLTQGLWDIKNGVAAFSEKTIDGARLNSIIEPLGNLAGAIAKWSGVTIPAGLTQGLWDIKNGVSAFGEKSIDGARLNSIVEPLGNLAGAIAKWSGITIPVGLTQGLWDIKNGVAAFGDKAIDGARLDSIVAPLGNLAGAIAKWAGITIPTGLTQGLWDIKNGVAAFGDKAIDGSRMASIVDPLGALAGAVSKWQSIVVPASLTQGLWDIKNGVAAFGDKSVDGARMSSIVGPLGDMAGAVAKWASITVPASLTQGLWNIKNGVAAFGDKSVDGGRMSAVVGPLGSMAEAVTKWAGITVPPSLTQGLWNIKNGVAAFGDKSVDGGKLSAVVGPLGAMADAIAKWATVAVPAGLTQGLWDIKNGVAAFANIGDATTQLTDASRGIGAMASSMGNISADVLSAVGTKLKDLGQSISNFASTAGPSIDSINIAARALSGLGNASSTAVGQMSGLGNAFTSFGVVSASGIDQATAKIDGIAGHVSGAKGSISSIGDTANSMAGIVASAFDRVIGSINGANTPLSGFVSASNSTATSVGAAFNTIASLIESSLNNAASTISSFNGRFRSSGNALSTNLVDGMRSGTSMIGSTYTESINSALSSARSNYGGFHKAGAYLAEGFADGIRSGSNGAVSAAADMAARALVAAKHAADEKSPSKKAFKIGDYIGKGMENGIVNSTDAVVDKAYSMGSRAIDSLNESATKVPVISPVYDLSSLSTGSKAIDKLMTNTSLSLFDGKLSVPNLDYKDPRVSALAQYQSQMVDTNSRMISRLDSLNENMAEYQKAIENQELGVYMDGDKVASKLAKPMNQKLGTFSRRGTVR